MAWDKNSEAYKRHREAMADRMRTQRAAAADLGGFPPPKDPERKEQGRESFRFFCETYRPSAFSLGWSEDHLRIIERIEATVRDGGLFALAMPRGNGKTTLTVTAALWALLHGFRRWVCLIGATAPKAESLLDSLKTELRFNPLLAQDFPEVCLPVRALEGKAARAVGQTHNGKPTGIEWLSDKITLPTIEGSLASGGVVTVCGVTGDIRGQQRTTQEGEIIRPDYVLLDDPQTRESAKSGQQVVDRLAILNGDILGLAGPTTRIAGVMPCTVVYRNDMADQVLDREKCPEWHGERTQLIYGLPKRMDLWTQYQELRETCWRNGLDTSEATEFYLEHRDEMDEGCRAAWSERHQPNQVSAVQYAMDLYFRDAQAFFAEYQNQPLEVTADTLLPEDAIAQRVGSTSRGIVPEWAETLVGFVDIQDEMLFWVVSAWRKDFTGTVIDYGAWPDQRTTNFRYRDSRRTFSREFPGLSPEAKIRKALAACIDGLLEKAWPREDGEEVFIRRFLIDANWGQHRNLVLDFAKSRAKRGVMAALGKGIGPSSEPLNARHTRKLGRTVGTHWRIERSKDSPTRYVLSDTNYWKSFAHSRFAAEPGTSGSLTLYQAEPHVHKTFAAHQRAEFPTRTQGLNREVDVWKQKPDRPDNHWFDGVVGCCIAASMEGCSIPGDRVRLVRARRGTPEDAVPPGAPPKKQRRTRQAKPL